MGKLGGRRRHCLRSGEPRCPPDEESGSIDTSQRPNLPQLRFAPDPQQKGITRRAASRDQAELRRPCGELERSTWRRLFYGLADVPAVLAFQRRSSTSAIQLRPLRNTDQALAFIEEP